MQAVGECGHRRSLSTEPLAQRNKNRHTWSLESPPPPITDWRGYLCCVTWAVSPGKIKPIKSINNTGGGGSHVYKLPVTFFHRRRRSSLPTAVPAFRLTSPASCTVHPQRVTVRPSVLLSEGGRRDTPAQWLSGGAAAQLRAKCHH